MSNFDNSPDDFADCLRLPSDPSNCNSGLHEAVLAQTLGILCRRRRWKRIGRAGILIICYGAGILTMSVVRTSTNSTSDVARAPSPVIAGQSAGPSYTTAAQPANQHGLQQATAIKLTSYDLLRRQADRQLSDETDIPGAIHTYKRALQVASAGQRAVSLDQDSWLLMALKTDQSRPAFVEKLP
jgi:hypothetical protein